MNFSARDIAAIAVMTALLIGGQALFAQVQGVEVVTVLLLCFAYSFGSGRGMAAATAFSLLRCFLFGFDVKTILLYLLYYNAFAFLFGLLGKKNQPDQISLVSVIATELLFLALCSVAVVFLSGAIKISVLLVAGLKTLAWVVLSLGLGGFLAYNVLLLLTRISRTEKCLRAAKVVSVVVTAAVCTVCFTLMDDLLYPLFYGGWGSAAVTYFYASFAAMLPQTVCTVASVTLLFLPLTKIFSKAAKSIAK
jgi:hypothetical protein